MSTGSSLWYKRRSILVWSIVIALATTLSVHAGVSKYRYAHESPQQKCQTNVLKLNDPDKFCDAYNNIQSHKAVAEQQRRASLTPKQRCQEDHPATVQDPDTGDVFYNFCNDDGTVTTKTADELQADAENAQSDYYSNLQQQAQQDAQDNSSNTCSPISNEGTCYQPGEYCRNSDHGITGVAGNGESIICAYNNGWRWEPN